MSRKFYVRKAKESGYIGDTRKGSTQFYKDIVARDERVRDQLIALLGRDLNIKNTQRRQRVIDDIVRIRKKRVSTKITKRYVDKFVKRITRERIVYNYHYRQIVISVRATHQREDEDWVYLTRSNVTFTTREANISNAKLEEILAELEQQYEDGNWEYWGWESAQNPDFEVRVHQIRDRTITRRKVNTNEYDVLKYKNTPFFKQQLQYINWPQQVPIMDRLTEGTCGFNLISMYYDTPINELERISGLNRKDGMTPVQMEAICKALHRTVYVVDGRMQILCQNIEPQENTYDGDQRESVLVAIAHNGHYYTPSKDEQYRFMHHHRNHEDDIKEVDINTRTHKSKAINIVADGVEQAYEVAISYADEESMPTHNVTRHRFLVAQRDEEVTAEKARFDIIKSGYPDKSKSKELKGKREQHVEALNIIKRKWAGLIPNVKDLEAKDKDDQHRNIIVNQSNLNMLYARLIKGLNAYRCRMIGNDVISIKISKSVQIRAIKDYNVSMTVAKELGVDVCAQSPQQLTYQYFNNMKGDRWQSSTLNKNVRDLINFRSYAGINIMHEYEQKGRPIYAVDIKRNYTHVARSGDFYTMSYVNDIQPFNGVIDVEEPAIYYVECDEPYIFAGNGVFDYKVVAYGLRLGLIKLGDIKYKVAATKAPINDEILRTYVETIYKNVSNDTYRKIMVNHCIGMFGKKSKTTYNNTIIAVGVDDFAYYKNTTNSKNLVMFNDPNDITKALTINDEPVFAITETTKSGIQKTDILMRHAIVQRARVEVHKYIMAIKDAGHEVIGLKTDAITYVCGEGLDKYPIPQCPQIGDLREEDALKSMFDAPRPPTIMTDKFINGENKWTTDVFADPTKNYNVDDITKYKRAFIDGSAGTGKTHTANALRHKLNRDGLKVIMMAFTHVAANLLVDGVTINSALGINMSGGINVKAIDKICTEYDAIIVDEASMINDAGYMALNMFPDDMKMYIFGDFKQLPKIDVNNAGDVKPVDTIMFKALCGYTRITLTKYHRSNVAFGEQCLRFYECGELPHGIRGGPEMPISEDTVYISYTNAKRREINTMIMAQHGVGEVPANERLVLPTYFGEMSDRVYTMEKYDGRALSHILSNKEYYANLLNDSRSRSPDECLLIAEKYYMNSIEGKDGMRLKPVEYLNSGPDTRYYPLHAQGLAMLTRKVRHTIAGKYYYDLDMVNAHPTFFLQICQKRGLDTPFLSEYINNRNIIFEKLINNKFNRDYVKAMLLAAINGGSKDLNAYYAATNDKWVIDFANEMRMIHDVLCGDASVDVWNAHIAARRQLKKFEGSDKGSFINKLLINAESKALDAIVCALRERKLLGPNAKSYVLCNDGIMIDRDQPEVAEGIPLTLIRDLENVVRDVTGFVIRLSVKDMDVCALKIPTITDTYMPTNNSYFEPRILDEFTHIYEGLPVICNKTIDGLSHNNEFFTVEKRYTKGRNHVIGAPIKMSRKDEMAMKRQAYTKAHSNFIEKHGIVRVSKKYKVMFREHITEVVNDMKSNAKSMDEDGVFWALCGENKMIMVTQETLQRYFKPRYCLTAHKSQGRTLNGRVCITEFDKLLRAYPNREGAYVVITRVTDPANLTILDIETTGEPHATPVEMPSITHYDYASFTEYDDDY